MLIKWILQSKNKKMWKKKRCNSGEIFNEQLEKCTSSQSPSSLSKKCRSNEYYSQKNKKCIRKSTCKINQIFNEKIKSCENKKCKAVLEYYTQH